MICNYVPDPWPSAHEINRPMVKYCMQCRSPKVQTFSMQGHCKAMHFLLHPHDLVRILHMHRLASSSFTIGEVNGDRSVTFLHLSVSFFNNKQQQKKLHNLKAPIAEVILRWQAWKSNWAILATVTHYPNKPDATGFVAKRRHVISYCYPVDELGIRQRIYLHQWIGTARCTSPVLKNKLIAVFQWGICAWL